MPTEHGPKMAPQDVLKRLGQRLHELRKGAGLTQETLAVRAGITWHFVSAIERGTKAATVETLTSIASALDISLSELFLDVDRPLPREFRRLAMALAARDLPTQRGVLKLVEEAMALSDLHRAAPSSGSSDGARLRAAEGRGTKPTRR